MPHVSYGHGLVLYHIPKTGGTFAVRALASALGAPLHTEGQHDSAVDRQDYYPAAVIVREPVAWYGSIWRWLQRDGPGATQWAEKWSFQYQTDISFRRFLVWNAGLWRRVVDAYTPTPGVQLRTESLADDLSAWLDACGVTFDRAMLLRQQRAAVAETQMPAIDPALVDLIRFTERWRP